MNVISYWHVSSAAAVGLTSIYSFFGHSLEFCHKIIAFCPSNIIGPIASLIFLESSPSTVLNNLYFLTCFFLKADSAGARIAVPYLLPFSRVLLLLATFNCLIIFGIQTFGVLWESVCTPRPYLAGAGTPERPRAGGAGLSKRAFER